MCLKLNTFLRAVLWKQGQGNNLHLFGVVFGLLKASFKCEGVGKWGMGAPSLYRMMPGLLVHGLAKSILIVLVELTEL